MITALYRPIKFLAIKDSLAIANLVGAGGQIGTVFVSTNGGVNWSQCFYLQGPYTYPLVGYSVIISETNLFVGDGYGIRISTDSGRTWSDYLTPWMNETTTCFAMSDTELFAATYDVGIIASGRMGTRWTNNSDGLTDLDITSLCVNSGYLFAVDDSSRVWRRPLSEMIVDVKEHTKGLPSAFSLSQNYPNPFNPSTVISYQVPTNSTVMLKVYDVLGREIETLVNGRETAGTHSVTFDGTKLPSGVYFCRLTAPGVNIVRKMLLEK